MIAGVFVFAILSCFDSFWLEFVGLEGVLWGWLVSSHEDGVECTAKQIINFEIYALIYLKSNYN